jgi:transcriptional regulator
MRKVYITLKVNIIVTMNEGTLMNEVMENLFVGSDNSGIVDVEDSEIVDYNVTDSK